MTINNNNNNNWLEGSGYSGALNQLSGYLRAEQKVRGQRACFPST